MQKKKTLSELVESLVDLWFLWMKHHRIVNDESFSVSDRRFSGEECERLQTLRQKIIREIDDIVESEWIK